MFIHPDVFPGGAATPAARASASHRFHRGRHLWDPGAVDWAPARALPDDPPYWDDMFLGSVRTGGSAARRTFKPALCVWMLMASIVYCFPSDLQIPLSILAVTIWVLVLSVLTADTRNEND